MTTFALILGGILAALFALTSIDELMKACKTFNDAVKKGRVTQADAMLFIGIAVFGGFAAAGFLVMMGLLYR